MKFIHNSFDNYLQEYDKINLHPKLSSVFKSFPDDITKMRNIILYGPENSGKYTQFLQSIRKYSNSKLKYEKKLTIETNKQDFFIKISDIHYEVDISLLGCNAKVLWNNIFNQIVDIILTKPKKNGIIVCKNFHTIHSELLDIFYSYMQKNICNYYNIVFFLLTEQVSFIPDNILKQFITSSYQFKQIMNDIPDKNINIINQKHERSIMVTVKILTQDYHEHLSVHGNVLGDIGFTYVSNSDNEHDLKIGNYNFFKFRY